MNITVRIQSNYGAQAVYPVCPKAQAFAAISGRKTLTPDTIKHIKTLGYSIEVQVEKVTL